MICSCCRQWLIACNTIVQKGVQGPNILYKVICINKLGLHELYQSHFRQLHFPCTVKWPHLGWKKRQIYNSVITDRFPTYKLQTWYFGELTWSCACRTSCLYTRWHDPSLCNSYILLCSICGAHSLELFYTTRGQGSRETLEGSCR